MNINDEGNAMSANTFLKEASALIGLFATVYLWSLIGLALQG